MDESLRRLDTLLTGALTGLSASQTQAVPREHPEKWNIQQIVEHLVLSYRSTIPILQARLDKGSPTRAQPSLQQRLGQWMITRMGHFPVGRTAPALVSPSRPDALRSGVDLAARAQVEIARIDGLLTEGKALFGDERAASHMILGPLSMHQWARFHLIHGQHHIKQINQIRKENKF